MNSLSPELLELIFIYLPKYFLLIGSVSKQFRLLYQNIHGNQTSCIHFVFNPNQLQWLRDFPSFKTHSVNTVSSLGYLKTLKRLINYGYNVNTSTMNCAARNGHLHVIIWLIYQNCSYDENVAFCALESGNIVLLEWLRKNVFDFHTSVDILNFAVCTGKLHVVKWARFHECPWNKETCSYAAYHGHLHILKWLLMNGCKWNSNVCRLACSNGHLDIVQWVAENELIPRRSIFPCLWAAFNNKEQIVQWCIENEMSWNYDSYKKSMTLKSYTQYMKEIFLNSQLHDNFLREMKEMKLFY